MTADGVIQRLQENLDFERKRSAELAEKAREAVALSMANGEVIRHWQNVTGVISPDDLEVVEVGDE